MLVIDLHTNKYSDVDEREAFAMQLRGTHQLVHTSAVHSYWYALNILGNRFLPGEPAIATYNRYARWYSEVFNLTLINGVFRPR